MVTDLSFSPESTKCLLSAMRIFSDSLMAVRECNEWSSVERFGAEDKFKFMYWCALSVINQTFFLLLGDHTIKDGYNGSVYYSHRFIISQRLYLATITVTLNQHYDNKGDVTQDVVFWMLSCIHLCEQFLSLVIIN